MSNRVVRIMLAPEIGETMSYFRAIVAKQELSERALALTQRTVELIPGFYSGWNYRRKILAALGTDYDKEIQLVDRVLMRNAKSYQAWQHRLIMASNSPQCALEDLERVEKFLKEDPKNYHAWSYRQWILRNCVPEAQKHIANELKFTDELLRDDVRNNSAWSHRFTIVEHLEGGSPAALRREHNYVKAALDRVTLNESAWNYLEGLSKLPKYSQGLWEDGIAYAVEHFRKNDSNRFALAYLCAQLMRPECPVMDAEILDLDQTSDVEFGQRVREAGELSAVGHDASDAAAAVAAAESDNPDKESSKTEASSDELKKPVSAARTGGDAEDPESYERGNPEAKLEGASYLNNAKVALRCAQRLIALDSVRSKYWRYRETQIESVIRELEKASDEE